ncbi:MAG: CYTH domain-containing protein [Candidatus Taylorbacteria bacterium]
MNSFEIEIKSLLGAKEVAEEFKKRLQSARPKMKLVSEGRQLNHYFNLAKDLKILENALIDMVPSEKKDSLKNILEHGNKISLRTRDADGKVILVLKASIGGDTSANGVQRIEFEAELKGKSLEELDKALLGAGCSYQAKWSRAREEYADGDIHICMDKNAGYGYLVEFEKVISDKADSDKAHKELIAFMKELGVEELPQDRLERMFAYYNAHWPEYYGTENTFTVK